MIFCDVSGSMGSGISGGKNYGSIRTCMELAMMLGLMIKSKCENCSFYIFSSPSHNHPCFIKIDELKGNLLEDMESL